MIDETNSTDEATTPAQQEPQPVRYAEATVMLGYQCPGCQRKQAVGGDSLLTHWFAGAIVQVPCSACAATVRLVKPKQKEERRIVPPTQQRPSGPLLSLIKR